MSETFHLPDLGEGLSSAVLREWRVHIGDVVHAEDIICTVETAKAVVELPAPYTGTLETCHVKSGDTVPTGAPLCNIALQANTTQPQSEKPATVVGQLASDADKLATESSNTISTQNQAYALPAARAYAKAHHIDLQNIKGSGPDGLIVPTDVMQQHNPTSKLDSHRAQMFAMMQTANRQVMQTTVMDGLLLQHKHAITIDLILALVQALQHHPIFNATWTDSEGLIMHDSIDVGLAMHRDKKLYVPVLRSLQQQNKTKIAAIIANMKNCLAKHQFSPEMLASPRFVLSNFGAFGAGTYATPVVVPPGLAIIAVGRLMTNPIWCEKQKAWQCGLHLPLSLTFDHRLITGGEAAIFLKDFMDQFLSIHAESVA